MKKIGMCFVCLMFLICLLGCSDFEEPLSLEKVRESAFSCFGEHNEEMRDIISRNLVTGETDWCKDYNLLTDGQYEFVLHRWGFTGTNICAGILFLSDDMPESDYIQDESNKNIYTNAVNSVDEYYLERIEANWFYFYAEYDF